MKFYQIVKVLLLLLSSLMLLSCGSGDTGTASNATGGRVSLLITDGPTNDFEQINITLESISFLTEAEEAGNEAFVFNETRVINLLALQNYSDLLATTVIPVGIYNKIRLHVSQVELVRLDAAGNVAESHLAKLPANGKIDLNPKGSFEVTGDNHLMIELDVDAEKSIHIVETGNGKFNFRPVIFVNILGQDDLKLVMLDGKVLASTETGFQLCGVDAEAVNDNCLAVLLSENSRVQNDLINIVEQSLLVDNSIVKVLGKAGSKSVHVLHVVIAADEPENQNLALFTGAATSSLDIENTFSMKTDDKNNVVLPGTLLSVLIADGARVFDKYGKAVSGDAIANGSDVDVFGLALPELSTVTDVKAAFIIINNEKQSDNVSGTITAINSTNSEITLLVVNDTFSGDVCVNVNNAHMFLLGIVGDSINSNEVSINNLNTGMSVTVYGDDTNIGCLIADVVLVTED